MKLVIAKKKIIECFKAVLYWGGDVPLLGVSRNLRPQTANQRETIQTFVRSI